MIGKLIKWGFYLVIILIIFAILPENVLEGLKKFFNWDIFFNTLKTGFNNLINFIQEATGIDFDQILIKLKTTFGIDLVFLWETIKKFLANIFLKLANIFQ